MPVTERLMASGQWSLKLDPAIPKATRDLLDFFGCIFIFDTPQRSGQGDASMIATSRWGGIVRRRQTPFDVSGVNMIAWLGDEDGKGPIWETAKTGTGATFATFVGLLLPSAVSSGSLGPVAGTKTITYQWVTPRAAIDNLCAQFGAEYRVNKDASFDAGAAGTSFLFKTTPTAVALRRSSGRDLNVTGLSVMKLGVSIDAEEYVSRTLVQDSTNAWTADGTGSVAFRGLGTDTDGTLGAWTTDAGTPTIAANVVTGTAGTFISAGSTTWADQTFTCRIQWKTTGGNVICVRYNGTANRIGLQLSGTFLTPFKVIANVQTNGVAQAAAPVNNTFYWLRISMVGTAMMGTLYSDVAGAIGGSIGSVSMVIADAAVATGQIALQFASGVDSFGGAYPNVCVVQLPTAYKDLKGNLVQMTKATVSTQTPAASASGLAANLEISNSVLRNEVTLTTDQFDIDRDVNVGDWIWVYDEDSNMVDTTNAVRYRGSTIYPIKLRVLASTWPIERGMGIWYRSGVGVWTDLTNYVLFEQPGTTFEVGAKSRALLTTP